MEATAQCNNLTRKLKSSYYSCHRAKPKHLEADSATVSCGCDNQKPVLATRRSYTVRTCSYHKVRFSHEEADTRIHRRKMSAHALLKMARDLFRAMSLAPRQKCPRNVVEMKEAMAAFFWQ